MNNWLNSFIALFFPKTCIICDGALHSDEDRLCIKCHIDLPRTGFHTKESNPVEKLLWGRMPVEKASSFFSYERGSDFRHILYRLKYEGDKDLCRIMGRQIAVEMAESAFFEDIDALIPIPLHRKKKRQRGYNQSELIAHGISEITAIPVDAASITRSKYTETQTRKSVFQRFENVDTIFSVSRPGDLAGKHILLVDDVLTTGATIISAGEVLRQIPGIRLSVLTLSMAR